MNLFIEKLKKLFEQKYFAAAFPPVVQLKNPPPSEMLWPQRLYLSRSIFLLAINHPQVLQSHLQIQSLCHSQQHLC